MMKRAEFVSALVARRTNEIMVGVYGSGMELLTQQNHPLNYYAVGAMGLASSHGLGLAIGCPERRVIVLDGDGSLLMNLGTLVTCAGSAPPNLVHCVLANGTYEANGGYPLPGADRVSIPDLARAAGYQKIHDFRTIDEVNSNLDVFFDQPGPVFVTVRIEPEPCGFIDYKTMYAPERRSEFSSAL